MFGRYLGRQSLTQPLILLGMALAVVAQWGCSGQSQSVNARPVSGSPDKGPSDQGKSDQGTDSTANQESASSTKSATKGDSGSGAGAVKGKATKKGKPVYEVATFGGGCFWCIEAVFKEMKGVSKVVSGYSGGHVKNPTYEEICKKTTGHAEVIQITYDPEVVTFKDLLQVFWKVHDPTTLNRQGNDVGPQYRSVVFYHDDSQKEQATHYKQRLMEEKVFDSPIVTEISPMKEFYPAENYHQNYFALNPNEGYCQFVIRPKVEKFRKAFADKLKGEAKKEEAEK